VRASGTTPLIHFTAIALVLAAGCGPKRIATTAPARVQVVLLPDPESAAPSSVTVTAKSDTVALTAPYESTNVVTNRAPSPPVPMDEAEVQRQYGSVIAGLPPAAQRFSLFFRTDSLELAAESRAVLPEVIRAASARKVPEVSVIGHTDTTGSSRNNYKLGLERARSVSTLLIQAGLDGALIEIESHGEADLLRKTPDNTAEPRNRRVEITIR